MPKFKVSECEIKDLLIIEPTVFGDSRGYFMETYNQRELAKAGLNVCFVQDNQSKSIGGVLRGLHFQKHFPQGKLVRVISGAVFDVAVDLRPESVTFGRWHAEVLSAENMKQMYVPEGFAHGFYVLSDEAVFCYKCTNYYHPDDEGGIRWDDAAIGINWPLIPGTEVLLSEKDKKHPSFEEYLAAQKV